MSDKNYFVLNLKNLSEKYSQKQLAQDTQVSPASINNYLNKDSEPSVKFLLKLKNAYGINIDEFLTKEVSPENKSTEEIGRSYKRFVGDYAIYYYDTNVYKGRVSYSTNILKYGVLSVYDEMGDEGESLKVSACFFVSRREAEEGLRTLNALKNTSAKKEFYNTFQNHYTGILEMSTLQIFISVKNPVDKDHCLIILNNPPSNNKYIGGLGTVNSVARGREQMPCIQFIILSRSALRMPDGELYEMLALGTSDVSVHNETEQLLNLFKTLYIENKENPNQLSEHQKKRIIEDSLSNMLLDMMEANMFRFAKVSNMEDDSYFRLIREGSEYDDE